MSWNPDTIVLKHFNKKSLPKWQWFFVMTAHVGFLFAVLYVLPILYLYGLGEVIAILQMTVFAISAIVLGYLMKALILRPRPHNHVTYLGKSDSSFPSSHTSVAIGLAVILHLYLPGLTVLWFFLATLVGFGRIYIQMHYLSDVLGGIVIGFVFAFLTLYFLQPYYVHLLIG